MTKQYEPTMEINKRILNYLKANARPVATTELVRELKLSYQDVYNALVVLIALDLVVDARPAGYSPAQSETAGQYNETPPDYLELYETCPGCGSYDIYLEDDLWDCADCDLQFGQPDRSRTP